MATFSGEAVTPSPLVAEGAVRLDGASVGDVSLLEGSVRLAGEAITESYQYVFPILQPIVTTSDVAWASSNVLASSQPAVATDGVAWASGVVAAAVAPGAGTGNVTWTGSTVTAGGAVVQPVVPTANVTWSGGSVSVRRARPPAQTLAAGPANPVYLDILRQGEAVPERAPDNVYVFRPRAEPPMVFEHRQTERRLMVAGIGYEPGTVNLWAVGLTALVVASVFFAARRR